MYSWAIVNDKFNYTISFLVAYTSKYGPSWYSKIDGYKFLRNGTWSDRTINREHELDEQGFFPKITNQNECRALNCKLSWQCSDCCWIWDQSWEQVSVYCELINAPGFLWDNFGPGCYCKSYGRHDTHECCFREGTNGGCTKDLESREHPCNNIEGITEDTDGNPLLPPTEKTNRGSNCYISMNAKGIIKRIL